jgi:hypothetical protein
MKTRLAKVLVEAETKMTRRRRDENAALLPRHIRFKPPLLHLKLDYDIVTIMFVYLGPGVG